LGLLKVEHVTGTRQLAYQEERRAIYVM